MKNKESKLNFEQFMILSQIIDEIGIDVIKPDKDVEEKLRVANLIKDKDKREAKLKAIQSMVGMTLIFKVFSRLYRAKNTVKELISSYLNIDISKVDKVSPADLLKVLDDLKDDILSFFTQKGNSTKSNV